MIWHVEMADADGRVLDDESGYVAAPDEASAERLGWLLVERAQLDGVDVEGCRVIESFGPIRKQAN